MTDDKLEKPASLSVGQQLRAAREAQGIGIEDVARQLLLSRQLVTDMENDDYRNIVAPVYVRGYLRSYAQFLKLSIDPSLIKDLKNVIPIAPNVGHRITPNMGKPKSEGKVNFFGYVMVAIFVLLVLLWWHATKLRKDTAPEVVSGITTELQLPGSQVQSAVNLQTSSSRAQLAPTVSQTVSSPQEADVIDDHPAVISQPSEAKKE